MTTNRYSLDKTSPSLEAFISPPPWTKPDGMPLEPPLSDSDELPLRSPEELMQPERLGAFWLSRLSFARLMINHIAKHRWQIEPVHRDLDEEGRGEVIYRIKTHERPLHFVVFSNKLAEEERNDRVIADRWDAAVALCQGEMNFERLAHLRGEVPRQEYGRADANTLVWGRGNRSSRFFNHVVERLALGQQPEVDLLAEGGYIMRSTAFYANAKFGLAAFETLAEGHALFGSYQAQMFAAFMLREFAADLAEHIAQVRQNKAAKLDPKIRRFLGLGNATGMGLVPFVINHPKITHTWCMLREIALAQAKTTQPKPNGADTQRLLALFDHCLTYFQEDTTDKKGIFTAASTLIADLTRLKNLITEFKSHGMLNGTSSNHAWQSLCEWARAEVNIESQELLHALLIELYPENIDELSAYLNVNETYEVTPEMTLGALQTLIERDYDWVLKLDMSRAEACHFFWYFSEDSEEPLIGVRGQEPGEAMERPLDIPRRIHHLVADLGQVSPEKTVGYFLVRYPEHRFIIQRVQSLAGYRYAEPRTNLMGADFIPLYLQRFQLAMYGMERFNPQSINWVRVTLLQGAPTAQDLMTGVEDNWVFPLKPAGD